MIFQGVITLKEKVLLHIGAGSFHRAHQAWYFHKLREQGELSWSIAIGNIRNDAVPLLQHLAEQHGEYVLETVNPDGERHYETITSIKKILPWDPELASLVEQGKKLETRIISFTVTESGYYLTPDHQLDFTHPDIQADLNGEARTIYGTLTRILMARMIEAEAPVTLLSCDNLRHNGTYFRQALVSFLNQKGETGLIQWVCLNTTCPNTMVDRITPRPTPDVSVRVKQKTGIDDEVPVMAESFIQWVIEDNFIAGRPPLERVGVEMVKSVLPWEEAKIRILNASHAAIAWAGTLAGFHFIDESIHQIPIYQFVWKYITHDVIPCLSPSPVDLESYRDQVLARFANPFIKDTNQRVGADGLSKIPGMITPTMAECFERGHEPDSSGMLPALFFVFLKDWASGKLPYPYQDGVLNEDVLSKVFQSKTPLELYINDTTLFGDLTVNDQFHALMNRKVIEVEEWLKKTRQCENGSVHV